MPAATSALPTLSTVQAWDTGHLTTAAQHWTSRATTWESAFTDVYREMPNPGGTSWSGAAADAALLRAHSDRVKVLAAVDQLHNAAATARSGALELDGAKQRVLSAVNSAQSAGYVVTEDLSVGYPRRVSSPAEAAIRQVQAQTMATDIRTRAGTLATLDHKVAADITAKAMGVGAMDFPEAPPGADALSVKNEKDVHRIVDPLPPGRSPGVKMVPNGGTPGLFGTLTENGTPIPPGTYPGQVSVLPGRHTDQLPPHQQVGRRDDRHQVSRWQHREDPRVPRAATAPRTRTRAGPGTRACSRTCAGSRAATSDNSGTRHSPAQPAPAAVSSRRGNWRLRRPPEASGWEFS